MKGKPSPLRGACLATVCVPRSDEILAEESDPNRHGSGIYVLAASFPWDFASLSLVRSANFDFLREDITCSLKTRHPLKMDLGSLQSLQLFHPSFTNRQPKYLALCSARRHHLFLSILSAPLPVAGCS